MTRRSFALIAFSASAAIAQTKWPNALKTWFPDGTALEIHTESTGSNSPISTSGSVAVGAGNDVHRVVIDRQGAMLFAYDIEARKTGQGTFSMRIKPVDQEKIRAESWFPRDKVAPGAVSTLAAARDFPPLRIGDRIEVDVLYHPATGEKIFDVILVSAEPPPGGRPKKRYGNQFSFQEVRVAIDGKTIHEPQNSWIIGESAAIFLPGRGWYYLTLTPPADLPFRAYGWVDRNVLRFHAGTEFIEVTGKSNALDKSEFGTVWIYHVPGGDLAAFEIRTAEEVGMLIPKKKKRSERD